MDRAYYYRHVRYLILAMITTGTFLQYILNHDFGLLSYPENMFTFIKNRNHTCQPPPDAIPDFFWLPVVDISTPNLIKYRHTHLLPDDRDLLSNTYYYGIVCSQILSTYFYLKFSIKNVIGYAIVVSAICNMFTFTASELTFWPLFILRFSVAFFSTFIFPGFFALIAKWSAPSERSFFVFGILMSINLGYILIKPLMCVISLLMTKEAWCSTISFMLLVWAIIWFSLVQDSPHNNSWITFNELLHITDTQEAAGYFQVLTVNHGLISWKGLCKCIPLWGLIFASFSHYWNFIMLLYYYPFSITLFFGTNINNTTIFAMLPNIIHILGALCFAILQYYAINSKMLTITGVRKIFVMPAYILPGFILFIEANVDCDQLSSLIRILLIFFLTSAVVASTLSNAIDLTPNHASTAFAVVNTISTISVISIPMLVKIDSIVQWRQILVAGGCLYLVSGIVYMSIGSGVIQDWCRPTLQSKHREQLWRRKTSRLHLPEVLSDIIEESESKILST